MSEYLQKPNTLPWPPMIYVAALGAAFVLQSAMPIAGMDHLLARLPKIVGFVILSAGLALDVAAMWSLNAHDTAILPTTRASTLVTDGVFGFSRNPIYLGNTIALLGLALALRSTWLLAALLLATGAVRVLAIAPEEKHLAANFGAEWDAYAQRVGRWL